MLRAIALLLLLAGCEKADSPQTEKRPPPASETTADAGVIGPRRIVLPRPPAPADRPTVVIAIDRDGAVYVGGTQFEPDALPQALADLRRTGIDDVTVDADSTLTYGVVVRLIEVIKQAGFTQIQLRTAQDRGVTLRPLPRGP
jgi:biopolymer transport protein ExbD